ncbi:MAG: CehA/McbA family metallohydrolase [Deltaproteobacteria bacterium]
MIPRPIDARRWAPALLSSVVLCGLVLTHELGCKTTSCLVAADETCTMQSPCERLAYECASGAASVRRITRDDDDIPVGLDALGAEGDVLLENDRVRVVIDAIDHPHALAPTGGTIIDLATRAENRDGMESIFTGVGLLPGDAVAYETLELLEGEGFAAVQVRGHLDGDESIVVNTRYELRPCEPGVRIRTEMVNLSLDDRVVALVDGWFWGGRSEIPFTPTAGRGFDQPSFGLTEIGDVYESFPYMAASGHGVDPTAVGITRCDAPMLDGFQDVEVSATGMPRRILPPSDFEVYERFITVADGVAIGPAVDQLLEARRQLFDETWAVVSGRIEVQGGRSINDNETRSPVIVYEGDPSTPMHERVPVTQVVPDADGRFSARVRRRRSYGYTVTAFGRTVVDDAIGPVNEDRTIDTRLIPSAARVTLVVAEDGAPTTAQVFFHPADPATRDAVTARLFDNFEECAPLLGPPMGGSPACNRVLVREPVTLDVPPGRYDVYATRGPFSSLVRREVELAAAQEVQLLFELASLADLRPNGALSADFHVHGGASFDSSIPDRDRVLAFLAANVDVIAATEHDAVWSYEEALAALNVGDRLVVMPGLETTGHILFDWVPDSDFPRVVGHWNFWPMTFDPNGPYRGGPWDELAEPGTLIERVVATGFPAHGVVQLNHPWGAMFFGRDTGFPRALSLDANLPIPASRDDRGQSLLATMPPGTERSNADYDTQEVMNGSANEDYLGHRAYWFYLLEHGVVRAGTANSDSHGLTDSVLGSPRNIVFANVDTATFDEVAFNTAVKRGRMFGTNGPMLEVATLDTSGATVTPSVDVFEAAPNASLVVRVRAAPWVPVDRVRVVVNGEVVRVRSAPLVAPDPFSSSSNLLYDFAIPLAQLLPDDGRDAWIVVEAGAPLAENADLDCDGVVDTGDNNGDGRIDWRDVERNDDDVVDERDQDVDEDGDVDEDDVPERCDDEVGPVAEPPAPTDRADPLYHFRAVTPLGYPLAFSNPLLIDRDGDGRFTRGAK